MILQLAQEMLEEAVGSAARIWIGCSFSGRKRLVRIAAMLLLVNGAMDATDGAVEAWLAEDGFDDSVFKGLDEPKRIP